MSLATVGSTKKKRDLYPVWTALACFMMFGFGNLVPAWSVLTQLGVKVLGVFIGALVMTIFTNQTFWPSIIAIFALVFHGQLTANAALSGWLGSSTIAQFIFIMALCGALSDSGAPTVIAKRMIGSKLAAGRPLLFIYIYFFAIVVASMLLSPTASVILALSLWDAIRDAAGYEKDDPFSKLMALGSYLAVLGSYVLPFKGIHLATIAILKTSMEGFGIAFDDGAYFISTFTVVMVFLLVFTLFIKFVFRCNLEPLQNFKAQSLEGMDENSLRLNKRQIILLSALGVGVFYIISLMFLPATLPWYGVYNGLSATWIWIAIVALLTMFKMDGEPFIVAQQIMSKHILWNIVALMGAFSFLGAAISSDELGIKAWIGIVLEPMLGGASWPVMIFIVVAISAIATNFMNGMPVSFAMSSLTMPFACRLALAQGLNVTVMGAAILMSGQVAFMTYGAMVYAALLLSREEIDQKFIWTRGTITVFIYIVVASVLFSIFGYIL